MWNRMPELLWILAGFNITKLETLKLAGLVLLVVLMVTTCYY